MSEANPLDSEALRCDIPFELGTRPGTPGVVDLWAAYRCGCEVPGFAAFSEMDYLYSGMSVHNFHGGQR